MRSRAGYTLVEILIVLLIISIVTSIAVISIGRNENKEIESFANELSQMLSLAEEQAMLQPTVLGLMLSEHSLQFASFKAGSSAEKNTWIPLQDTILGKHDIPNAIQVAVEVGGSRTNSLDRDAKKNPPIIVSTNGEVTPFTIYLGKKGEKPRYIVTGDADGQITTKALS
jgi:general secretion pathway protein H